MEKLWEGVTIKVNGKPVKIRAAISCLACDVPAARKVGGFVGHRGYSSCNKCYKTVIILTIQDLKNQNGKDDNMHYMYGMLANKKTARSESERKAVESEFGARYSLLYELDAR